MKKKISRKTTLTELAAIVCSTLKDHGIEAILTGGSAVTVYSQNEYESGDLDFITHAKEKELSKVLSTIGFKKSGKSFNHKDTEYFLEFPGSVIQIGDLTIHKWNRKKTPFGTIFILTPTNCVMDRLAAFYHWNDKQSLDQALMVAKKNKIDLKDIEKWSKQEGELEKFKEFKNQLN